MQLRRVFTTFVVTFALSILLLGRWVGVPADETGPADFDGEVGAIDTPVPVTLPPPTLVATPKGKKVTRRVVLGHDDIPLTALLAYQRAAGILAAVEPSCGLTWTLLAAIGRVESDHGRHGGAKLGTDGVPHPQVVGVALDGGGPVARIRDTDDGRLDGDRTWDRAVGPMQFLPTTWDMVGVDGDGDGVRSVDDVDDAALAAGIYLCAGPEGSLREPQSVRSALLRYNDSDAYVALVMAYERRYRTGEFDVLAGDGAVAEATAVLTARPLSGTPLVAKGPAQARRQAQLAAAVSKTVRTTKQKGAVTPGVSAGTPTQPAGTPSGKGTSPGNGGSAGPSPSGAPASDGNAAPPSAPATDAGTDSGPTAGADTSSPPAESPAGTPTGTGSTPGTDGPGSGPSASPSEDTCSVVPPQEGGDGAGSQPEPAESPAGSEEAREGEQGCEDAATEPQQTCSPQCPEPPVESP